MPCVRQPVHSCPCDVLVHSAPLSLSPMLLPAGCAPWHAQCVNTCAVSIWSTNRYVPERSDSALLGDNDPTVNALLRTNKRIAFVESMLKNEHGSLLSPARPCWPPQHFTRASSAGGAIAQCGACSSVIPCIHDGLPIACLTLQTLIVFTSQRPRARACP